MQHAASTLAPPTPQELPETLGLQAKRKLPARDYWLIPFISLATLLVMFGAAELGTRLLYPEKDYEACRVQGETDPRRAKPNCTVRTKAPEGPWVTYSMNECGYRTSASCGPKAPGTIRLALLGASMTMGKNVPLEETWGERTARAVAEATQQKVEVENLGWELLTPLHCYRQLPKVIEMRPDLVVYAVNPFDLSRGIDRQQLAHRNDPVPFPLPATPVAERKGPGVQDIVKYIQNSLSDSRAVTMAQHFLFSNPETFLRVYLADGDRADFVRQPFTPAWQSRFADFNLIVTEMAARLRRAGIPFVVVILPARAQVALVEPGHSPASNNVDPWAFERAIEKVCKNADVPCVSTLKAFSRWPNADKLFYIVDTHITSDGNGIIAEELTRRVLDSSQPIFKTVNARK
jgi:hypothetical protein